MTKRVPNARREFAQLVGLFVGQPATAEGQPQCPCRALRCISRMVAAMWSRATSQGHRDQLPAVAAEQRAGEPVRCRDDSGAAPALLAQATTIGRVPRLHGEPGRRGQPHRALERAVGQWVAALAAGRTFRA